MTGEVWTVGASTGQFKFDATAWGPYTATGAAIANIKGAVIFCSGSTGLLLAYATLTASQFTLAQGNTITVTPAAGGILTLV